MNAESIIRQIDDEIARLQQVRQLLAAMFPQRGPGRPPKTGTVAPTKAPRRLSAAARARIAAAQQLAYYPEIDIWQPNRLDHWIRADLSLVMDNF